MKAGLTNLVAWSHFFLAEVLKPGDAAVDLTAGAGRDTLFLARRVAPGGKVFAFDVQDEAIKKTSALLKEENIAFRFFDEKSGGQPGEGGVCLCHASHVRIDAFVNEGVKAVIGNLGYLPGGDKKLTTQKDATLASLSKAVRMITAGGRLVVVSYVGHPEGLEEKRAVSVFFKSLNEGEWRSLKVKPWNRGNAPVLWVAEKISKAGEFSHII